MEKKRILMVHNFYQIGGGEHTVFENEVKLLRDHGHTVILYTRSNDELKTSRLKMLLMPLTTIWSLRTYFEVRSLIRKENIQVVHCQNTFPLVSPSVYYAARSLKVPVVQTIHNFRLLCPCGTFYREGKICEACAACGSFRPALKHRCYRNSRVQTAVVAAMLKVHRALGTYRKINYIFLTEFNKSKFSGLLDIHGSNVFVKPNFVPSVCLPRKQELSPEFVFVGRLDRYKGISFLLEVWKTFPADYQLHIFGDGDLRDACETAARNQENIHFYGFCPQQQVFERLAESAALLFPSELYEGFPMLIGESFCLGVPLVCTMLGNHWDVVSQSGGGVGFPVGDAAAFRQALAEVLRGREQYAGCARAYYEKYLTEEQNYLVLRDVYERAKHIS